MNWEIETPVHRMDGSDDNEHATGINSPDWGAILKRPAHEGVRVHHMYLQFPRPMIDRPAADALVKATVDGLNMLPVPPHGYVMVMTAEARDRVASALMNEARLEYEGGTHGASVTWWVINEINTLLVQVGAKEVPLPPMGASEHVSAAELETALKGFDWYPHGADDDRHPAEVA